MVGEIKIQLSTILYSKCVHSFYVTILNGGGRVYLGRVIFDTLGAV